MHKVFQINVGNCLMTINEDAYTSLAAYLQRLKTYFFAQGESGEEVYADIENRVAELFLERIKTTKKKRSISLADVDEVVQIMGELSDLGIEDDEQMSSGQSKLSASVPPKATTKKKRFARIVSEQKLFGVSAGIAHYFEMDPFWIRFLFVGLALWNGIGVFLYMLLVIVMPVDRESKPVYRKFYRLPKDLWIAGVCTGLATYFKVRLWVVRLFFALPVIFLLVMDFDGFLFSLTWVLFFYAIVWGVVPLAKTSSDWLRVKGEAINVHSLRDQLSPIAEAASRNWVERMLILLFKFFGILLVFIGIMLCLLVTVLGMGLTFEATDYLLSGISFFSPFGEAINFVLIISLVAVFALPLLIMLFWGMSFWKKSLWLRGSLIGLWICWGVSFLCLVIGVFGVASHCSEAQRTTEERTLPTKAKTLHLSFEALPKLEDEIALPALSAVLLQEEISIIRFNQDSMLFQNIDFKLKATTMKQFYVTTTYVARESTKRKAQLVLRAIPSPVAFNADSTSLMVRPVSIYTPQQPYRGQYLYCTLYIPKGKSVAVVGDVSLNAFDHIKSHTVYTSEGTHLSSKEMEETEK